MKSVIFIGTTVLVSFAYAFSPQDPFMDLEKLFAEAAPVPVAEVQGWHAGRCFTYGDHLTARGALLAVVGKDVGQEGGPLFPPKWVNKILNLIGVAVSADYFDDLTPYRAGEVQRIIDREFGDVSEAQTKNDILSSEYESGNLEYQVKKNGQYLIVRNVTLKDEGQIRAGTTYDACYFFKKVR